MIAIIVFKIDLLTLFFTRTFKAFGFDTPFPRCAFHEISVTAYCSYGIYVVFQKYKEPTDMSKYVYISGDMDNVSI